MPLQQEVIIRDGKIVGSPPIATPSINKALVTDGNGNIVGSAVSKNTLEELNMLITDNTGQDIADALSALINAVKPDASDIKYDSSTTVKGKIDEVDDNLNTLFKRVRFSATYNISANGNVVLTPSDFNFVAPSGYKELSLYAYTTGNANIVVRNIYADGNVTLKNLSSTALSNLTTQIDIIFVKSIFM